MEDRTLARFLAKIDRQADGCWIWTASRTKDGYGHFWNGIKRPNETPIMVLAHRWSYEHFIGDPTGLNVCHRCDTPPCVNPEHFFLGTQADNVADCIAKNRRGVYPRRFLKLNAEIHAEIIRRYTGKRGEQTAMGREFGVSQATVRDILVRAGRL